MRIMAAVIQKNISLIITLITFVFSVGIMYARLESTATDLEEYIDITHNIQKELTRIDKETATILKDLQYIKEGVGEIKSKLK